MKTFELEIKTAIGDVIDRGVSPDDAERILRSLSQIGDMEAENKRLRRLLKRVCDLTDHPRHDHVSQHRTEMGVFYDVRKELANSTEGTP